MPNAQLAVGHGNRIVFVRGYTASTTERALQTITATVNMVSRTYNEPAYQTTQPNSRFRMASLSKLVTGLCHPATGARRQSGDERFRLTQSCAKTRPRLFLLAPQRTNMLNVTARQLWSTMRPGSHVAPRCPRPSGSRRTSSTTPIPGTVKPCNPYNVATIREERVKTRKRHIEIDLPRRKLHYVPAARRFRGWQLLPVLHQHLTTGPSASLKSALA